MAGHGVAGMPDHQHHHHHHQQQQQHYDPVPVPRPRPRRPSQPRPVPHPAADRRPRQAPMRQDYRPDYHPDYQYAAPSGRHPMRGQDQYYPEHQSAWEASQNLYDGSGYGDEYGQYAEYEQWPLPVQPSHSRSQSPSVHGSARKQPPRRPPRPDESPRQQDYQSPVRDQPRSRPPPPPPPSAPRQYRPPPQGSHHGNGQWTGDGYSYAPPAFPPPNRPPPPPQSAGRAAPQPAIPQYALPQPPPQAAYAQANRRAPLGPPPSARRGPAAHYPEVAPVHPIIEESDSSRGSMRKISVNTLGHDSNPSVASSNAIPIGIPQYYLDHNGVPQPNNTSQMSLSQYADNEDSPAEATAPRSFDREGQQSPEVLVRQASLGKKSKPRLTTVKSSEGVRNTSGEHGIKSLPSQQHAMDASRHPLPEPAGSELPRGAAQRQAEGQAEPGAAASDKKGDESNDRKVAAELPREGSPKRSADEAYNRSASAFDGSSTSGSENELRRKRSKELLGSAITDQLHPQRARVRSPLAPDDDTRIKSILENLEKGGAISAQDAEELKKPMGGLSERAGRKRPPRLNVEAVRDAEARGSLTSLTDLIRRATALASNLDRGKTASRFGMDWMDGADGHKKRRSGSIADMLNDFPPPGIVTPPGERGSMRRSLTNWSGMRHSALPSDSDAGDLRKDRRKCCGIPMWLFIVLLILLILLAAAAIVVPIVLIVIPRQNGQHHQNVGSCEQKLSCNNGGANILSSDGNCECLCVNGYTGPTCSSHAEQGCTTTQIGTNNATVGEAIPRLLQDAQRNFSVPLDGQQLLGLFSRSDLSCTTQNALVTFNSQDGRKRDAPALPLLPRQDAAATSNGIVFATGTPTAASPSSSSTTAAPQPTSTAPTASTLDFARVAVLYVFQSSGTAYLAGVAQENLQNYFSTGVALGSGAKIDARNITLGGGFAVDLVDRKILVVNGTTVGGAATGGGS